MKSLISISDIIKRVIMIGMVACFPSFCSAQPFTGQAIIENGNTKKAEEDAKREAMRAFVEMQCGVKVNSYSETENFLLVRDKIVAQSEGYVVVKKVISSKQTGDYYTVVLDLVAGNKPFELAENDIKGYLSTLGENSSRYGIDVAILGETPQDTDRWNKRLIESLKAKGFQTYKNDSLINFQRANLNSNSDYVAMRRIGRETTEGAKAIIRGYVGLARRAELVAPKTYCAIAEISCEIIGYESSRVDAVSRYYKAVADNAYVAEKRALEQVILEASEELAKQATVTSQQETRGGNINVKTLLSFSGIYNKGEERNIIMRALQNSSCTVVRSGYVANGNFQAFVSSSSYANLEELKEAVLNQIQLYYHNAYDQKNENAAGSTSYTIMLRG